MPDDVVVNLTTPITAYGEPVEELTLRRPTVRDIRECGYPFRIDESGQSFEPIASAIARYISRLGNIPMGSLDKMTPHDFNLTMAEVVGFFGESPETSGTSLAKPPPSLDDTPPNSSTSPQKT